MSIFFPFAGLGGIIYFWILVINGIAILSEDRFLARVGWGRSQQSADPGFGGAGRSDPDSVGSKMINLIHSVRTVTRVPLVVINIVIIIYEIVLG